MLYTAAIGCRHSLLRDQFEAENSCKCYSIVCSHFSPFMHSYEHFRWKGHLCSDHLCGTTGYFCALKHMLCIDYCVRVKLTQGRNDY